MDATMPAESNRQGHTNVAPVPMHRERQRIVVPRGEARRCKVLTIPMGPDQRIVGFGEPFPSREPWRLYTSRRQPDGRWVIDRSPGLGLDPAAFECFRDGVLHAAFEMGSPAPVVSFSYQAERYAEEAREGPPEAVVPQVVLEALGHAAGTGDVEGLARLEREALRYLRTHRPEYVPVGGGSQFLDCQGNSGRTVGKELLLLEAIRHCREVHSEEICDESAKDLEWKIENLHCAEYQASVLREAREPVASQPPRAPRADRRVPAREHPAEESSVASVRLTAGLSDWLWEHPGASPEQVAKQALAVFGLSKERIKHYFDYRRSGLDSSHSGIRTFRAGSKGLPLYIAVRPRLKPDRAVVVLPELLALGEHAVEVANRLAREGFLAVVPHFHHEHVGPLRRVEPRAELVRTGRVPGHAEVEENLRFALGWIATQYGQGRVAVGLLGLEDGGETASALALSGSLDVGAVVTIGSRTPRVGAEAAAVPLLSLLGEHDPRCRGSAGDSLRTSFGRLSSASQLRVLEGVGLGFFDPANCTVRVPRESMPHHPGGGRSDRPVLSGFDRAAAETAWRETIEFLRYHLRPVEASGTKTAPT